MSKIKNALAETRKALTALAAAAVTGAALVADGDLSTTDKWAIAFAFVGALGVYAVPNKPTGD